MNFVILIILTSLQICTSSVIFRIKSKNENIFINSSYLFGTIHVGNNLVWPFLSNDSIRLLTESDEFWMEHDFTDPPISKYIYDCTIEKMTSGQRTRLRARSWPRFLNETKEKLVNESTKSNNLIRWRKWFVNKEFLLSKQLWRNGTIDDSKIFDHRIVLEAYQRKKYVGSLENVPIDCYMVEKVDRIRKLQPQTQLPLQSLILLARVYNCDMIDADFVKEITKDFDFNKMKKRNQQMTKQIRRLLTNDPHKKYLFVVGAAHLFGNISVIEMLQNEFPNDYSIEQTHSPSPNFPAESCTDEEFGRLINLSRNALQNNQKIQRK